jgi:hypothetical protein
VWLTEEFYDGVREAGRKISKGMVGLVAAHMPLSLAPSLR